MNDRQGVPPYVIYIGIFIVVFVVALGVFLFTSQSKTKEFNLEATQYKAPTQVDQADAATGSASPAAQESNLKLTVASPEDNAYVNTNSIKIAGATKTGTTVTITGGAKDIASDTNSDGSFALDVPLKEGENNLTITVFDQSGQQKSINKTVYSIVEG